ncbi:MAG: GNAT family N-acetyltransferase [Pseudomonadota bacterium]
MREGFHDIPTGLIATTVTHLELAPSAPPSAPSLPAGIHLKQVRGMDIGRYRRLFRLIGEDWLWVSRLKMPDPKLQKILDAEETEVWLLRDGQADLGLCELDFSAAPDSGELAFFGVAPKLLGQGLARPMMVLALERAHRRNVHRFTVHTCTLDHPAALPFYQRMGFVPVRQEVEVMADPRLDGLLPETAAPHVPLIRPST